MTETSALADRFEKGKETVIEFKYPSEEIYTCIYSFVTKIMSRTDRTFLLDSLITILSEIIINGVVSKLEEIKEGERIRGEVRVEKKEGERRQVALKIYVDRATAVGG